MSRARQGCPPAGHLGTPGQAPMTLPHLPSWQRLPRQT